MKIPNLHAIRKNAPTKIGLAIASILFSYNSLAAEIEVIAVTAQKRVESLQEVPIAVTAFSGDQMKSLGVTDATDLVALTPGLTIKAQGGSSRNYYLRGVGTTDTHLTASSAVGQYFDGITLTSGFHAKAALFDIERVEVLKGPQNTLFGLNTTGGAVNFISKKPMVGDGTTGNFTIKVGSNALLNVDGAIGFDIGDDAAARIALMSNKMDGAFESVIDGKDYGDDDTQAFRAQVLWEINGESSILINAHGLQSNSNGTAVKSLGSRNPDGSGTICAEFDPQTIQDFTRTTNCVSRSAPAVGTGVPASAAINPSLSDWDKVNQDFGSEDLESNGIYLQFDYEFDSVTFSSISSFDHLEVKAESNRDGTGLGFFHFWQQDDRDTFQQEFRLVSTTDENYRWIAGVYWLNDEAESYTAIRTRHFQNGSFGALPNVQLDHNKENLGIYAQGEYDFNDSLTMTLGLRWSDEEINADYLPSKPDVSRFSANESFFVNDVNALATANIGKEAFDGNGFEIARQVNQQLSNEDIGFTAKLDWKPMENTLLYASYSRGFKGSAADIRAAFASVPVPNLEIGLEDARLEPESLDAWELGYKGSFADNTVQLDASVFHYIYENLQQFVTPGGVPTLENAPESVINGLDASLKYVNNSGLYVQLGLTYLDTEVTETGDSSFIEGAVLAASPELAYSIMASQDFDFDNGSFLTAMVNMSYTDEAASQTLTTGTSPVARALTIDGYTLVNANVTYHFGEDLQYGISVYGSNLTDENYCGTVDSVDAGNLAGVNSPAFPPAGVTDNFWQGTITCRVSNDSTRTFGLSFSSEF